MMRRDIEALLPQLPLLVSHIGDKGVILGTLGSMELNLKGFPFPGWSSADSRRAVAQRLLPVLQQLPGADWALQTEVAELSTDERYVLMERGQLTPSMAARQDGVHLLLNRAQDTECFINDEEHLHLQTFFPGADGIETAVKAMQTQRAAVAEQLPVAQDSIFGYLSYDPSKAGAGIFLSFLAFLPGLTLGKHMPQVRHALEDMGLYMSPLFSYLKKEVWDMCLIHSPAAAAGALDTTLAELRETLEALTQQELNARAKLIDTPKGASRIKRSVSEALHSLEHDSTLRYTAMLERLMLLRLGLYYGWYNSPLSPAEQSTLISKLYMLTAPIHMSICAGISSPKERRQQRAIVAQAFMKQLKLSTKDL